MTVSGWGRTVFGGEGSPVLKTIDVPGLSSEECQEKYLACPDCPPITDSMLCAESAPGGEDGGVCQGDSGGRSIKFKNLNDRWSDWIKV